ncbi:Small ribonucleoprotein (snRNP)-like [Metschnikowia aff. pulcherrima]|uniref:Small ribonucleoprotein (SnRNP)-like n=1 Tax=Metschnikowia aff. pulcherrima TaxID=2163413 RepID=A0A4P6XL66_9ASCO|nr:Small ribonucleoprotein (snRNP)-like [Metschnikowia aff. pulcherrima]
MKVQKFIGTNLRIMLEDGRLVDGRLVVVDPFGNLLLSNVYEISQDKLKPSELQRRELGLVSVPRSQIKNILLAESQIDVLRS